MSCSVFQDWYAKLPWKMQSIFVNGLRAPDVASKATKRVVRWLRVQSCHDADPKKPNCYMTAPIMNHALVTECVDELEYMACHYVHHLADAARVIAIYHPDEQVRGAAHFLHFLVAEEIFHFVPESDEQFIERHKDKVEHA
jgi:hypothetical protein